MVSSERCSFIAIDEMKSGKWRGKGQKARWAICASQQAAEARSSKVRQSGTTEGGEGAGDGGQGTGAHAGR